MPNRYIHQRTRVTAPTMRPGSVPPSRDLFKDPATQAAFDAYNETQERFRDFARKAAEARAAATVADEAHRAAIATAIQEGKPIDGIVSKAPERQAQAATMAQAAAAADRELKRRADMLAQRIAAEAPKALKATEAKARQAAEKLAKTASAVTKAHAEWDTAWREHLTLTRLSTVGGLMINNGQHNAETLPPVVSEALAWVTTRSAEVDALAEDIANLDSTAA